jgi:hypothetical protein
MYVLSTNRCIYSLCATVMGGVFDVYCVLCVAQIVSVPSMMLCQLCLCGALALWLCIGMRGPASGVCVLTGLLRQRH